MSKELKPCPFCGSEAKLGICDFAYCTECGKATGWKRTTEAAVKEWNTRPIEAALQAENGRRQAKLDKALDFIAAVSDEDGGFCSDCTRMAKEAQSLLEELTGGNQ